MAVLTGISGMNIGDGAGGNIALALKTGILNFINDSEHTFRTATINGQMNVGSATYRIPELIGTQAYGNDGGSYDTPQVGDITVKIDIRRWAAVEYESFDYSRLGSDSYVINMVISSIALSILNDLNLHFWDFLRQQFEGANAPLKAQNIVLPNLVKDGITQAESLAAIYQLQRKYIEITKTYNKHIMGIPKAHLNMILDPYADLNIRQAYVNQPNSLAERQIAENITMVQIGTGVYYTLDKMLGMNIAAGTSFSKDKALDMTPFIGFIIHNEAIAMPFNLHQTGYRENPKNMNPRFMAKYQFGIGMLRPSLVWAIRKAAPTK